MKINDRNVFEINHFVTSYEVDSFYHQRLSSFFSIIQEAAALHEALKHCSIPELNKENKTWIIIRNRMEIHKFPLWGDTVNVQSWPIPTSSFSSHRGTRVTDQNNKCCFDCKSVWGIIDTNKHILIKPGKIINRIGTVSKDDKEFYYFPKLPKSTPFLQTENSIFYRPKIQYYDSDYNCHINNISYINWIMQSLPTDVLDYYLPYFIDVTWLKETYSKDKLYVTTSIINNNGKPHFLHKIDKEITPYERETVCIAESKWDKRGNMAEKIKTPLFS